MKKIDKLVLTTFLGPFILTFCVVVFILLTQYMLKYFDEFVGKDIGIAVFAEMLFYFSLNMTPVALPLAVLLSSLIAFGNLGEHYELSAIKSAGISLVRVLFPIFIFSILITFCAYLFNNYIVPKANLKAYSLLYDIRTKKATLNIKEGIFYNGLPNYSIKANKKFPDQQTLKGLMIYNHSEGNGNTQVILADSGKMSTIYNDQYLVLELFDGCDYMEVTSNNNRPGQDDFVRNRFKRNKLVFSLASFKMERTKEEWFADNRMMKNVSELDKGIDSLTKQYNSAQKYLMVNAEQYYSHHLKRRSQDLDTLKGKWVDSLAKVTFPIPHTRTEILNRAVNQARGIQSFTKSSLDRLEVLNKDTNLYEVEKYRKFTQSLACLIMFLIGAPLGAIIKKGGLGVPVLVSIVFFIIFYVISILGEKWAKESVVLVPYGMWAANFVLFCVGMVFLRQARNDSRIFEADVYIAYFNRFMNKIRGARSRKSVSAE